MSKYTPMDLRHYTVPELRAMAKEAPANIPAGGFSKLRKAELIDFIVAAYETDELLSHAEQAEEELAGDEDDMTGHWAEQGADVDPEDVQVFQGAMHEATTPQAIGDTLTVLAGSMTGVAEALNTVGLAAQAAARKLAAVAWSHQVAVVRSMGHTVRGKVVDTVLREPGADGTGRVCLVVQHDGHPTRRTLHALSDVQFEALAS